MSFQQNLPWGGAGRGTNLGASAEMAAAFASPWEQLLTEVCGCDKQLSFTRQEPSTRLTVSTCPPVKNKSEEKISLPCSK